MQDFEYHRVKSVGEALTWLEKEGEGVRILSGGTDLLVQLREGRIKAHTLVDVKFIPEMNMVTYYLAEGLRIGAAVTCSQLCSNHEIIEYYPGLVDAVSLIGGTAIQGRASIGGNLCNASPAADSVPALIVHQAVCEVAGAHGRRLVKVEDFCTAPGKNCLGSDEFLTIIHLPPPEPSSGAAYKRFTPRKEMDIGVVGAGAWVKLAEDHKTVLSARLALGAVAPTPLFVKEAGEFLAGKTISEGIVKKAAEIAQEAARPIHDMRGSIPQRIHLAGVLALRALIAAVHRAGGLYA